MNLFIVIIVLDLKDYVLVNVGSSLKVRVNVDLVFLIGFEVWIYCLVVVVVELYDL